MHFVMENINVGLVNSQSAMMGLVYELRYLKGLLKEDVESQDVFEIIFHNPFSLSEMQ